jgi:hypothetical protein
MKKCYHFPAWREEKNACISFDEKSIYVQPTNMFVIKNADAIISLWDNDIVSCDTRYEDNAISNDCLDISKLHHTYTINGFKYEEDSLSPITSNALGNAKRFTEPTPSDPILVKLCKLTGAKMYGDYVVFEEKKVYVFAEESKWGRLIFLSKKHYHYTPPADLHPDNNLEETVSRFFTFEKQYLLYNIFEEYSKFLRGEESKWEEVKKLVL